MINKPQQLKLFILQDFEHLDKYREYYSVNLKEAINYSEPTEQAMTITQWYDYIDHLEYNYEEIQIERPINWHQSIGTPCNRLIHFVGDKD